MMMMMMTTWLMCVMCLAGVAVSAPPTAEETDECSKDNSERMMRMSGWPVVVAIQMQKLYNSQIQLHLSHPDLKFTKITLTHVNETSGIVVTKLDIVSPEKNASLLALLKPYLWARLRVTLHQGQLVVSVSQEAVGTVYTSHTVLHLMHHLSLQAVSYTCPSKCKIFVDLNCLHNKKSSSHKHTGMQNGGTMNSGVLVWPILVVVVLLLLVGAVYLAWRVQHEQIKRKQLQSMAVRASFRKSSQETSSPRGSPNRSQDSSTTERVHYSTVLVGYNGPYESSDDAT